MVSAVFHNPLAHARSRLADGGIAGGPGTGQRRRHAFACARRCTCAQATPARTPPIDWRGVWLRVLPPFIGFGAAARPVALLTMRPGEQHSDASGKPGKPPSSLFTDPFYRKGPNDQGIGWNILISLERVALGFGLAAAVGIPVGFMPSAASSSCQPHVQRR